MFENERVNQQNRIDFLRNVYFFHSMPIASLEKILGLCTERRFSAGSILFFEEMPGDLFFIVLEGEVEIWKRYGQPDSVLLGTSGSGQPIGEMALIDNRPRSATVKARTDLSTLVVQASDFDELLYTDNSICVTLLKAVTMMVRKSNEAHVSDLDRQNRELGRANTELRQAQEELISRERLSVLGKFSSLILHDIRNPLSALKTRVELLKMNREDPEYFDDAIKKIEGDIARMESLAAEFLDYARGDIRLNMSVSSIDRLFERFSDLIALKKSPGLQEVTVHNEVHKPVIIDEERMLRVLLNAADNACKALRNGGKISLRSQIEDDAVLISISDTGVGMAPEVLEHIFEPFYSSSSAGGTGLGMIIIKNIVEAHHGTVTVLSTVGQGTDVRIRLPVLA